ncbi:MAG: hypothetical protein OHK0012_24750 [Synechococcales cyanobacterium]
MPRLEQRLWRQHPVTVMTVDPRLTSLTLVRTTTGLQSLSALAAEQGLTTAINGGFFNRFTQHPLGALRWQHQWWSSPILGRGVVAWTDQGEVRLERLRWLGSLTGEGLAVPIVTLNSGYVVPGVAAYDHHWGSQYLPQTDDELVVVIRDGRVDGLYPGLGAGQHAFALSPDQWLVVARTPLGWQQVQDVMQGSPVQLTVQMDPPELARFPNMLGAGPLLIQDGQIVLDAERERFQPAFQQQRAARSALCVGDTVQMIRVGVAQETVGVTLAELATMLQEWGCPSALNLDGGSSTALVWQGQALSPGSLVHNGIGVR